MAKYIVGMMKERWVLYEAETPEEAKELAQADYSEWTVLGANDA